MNTEENAAVIRNAIALAEELDQIRFACGEECADHVKKTLATSPETPWERAVDEAVREWNDTHYRLLSDFA